MSHRPFEQGFVGVRPVFRLIRRETKWNSLCKCFMLFRSVVAQKTNEHFNNNAYPL